jgi:hypothetical protein
VQIECGADFQDLALERFDCFGALLAQFRFARSRFMRPLFENWQNNPWLATVDVVGPMPCYALARSVPAPIHARHASLRVIAGNGIQLHACALDVRSLTSSSRSHPRRSISCQLVQ